MIDDLNSVYPCFFVKLHVARWFFIPPPLSLLSRTDPPSAPVNFSVTRADGKTCEAIFTWQPDVLFGNTTIATTETFGLEVKKGTSGQWEEVGNHNYSIHEPASLTLEPEVAFEFRAYSWSHSVGKGKATVGEEFDTITGEH